MIQTIDNTENIHRKEDTDSKTVTQPDDQIEQGAILIEHPQGNGGENNTIANSDDDNEDNNPEEDGIIIHAGKLSNQKRTPSRSAFRIGSRPINSTTKDPVNSNSAANGNGNVVTNPNVSSISLLAQRQREVIYAGINEEEMKKLRFSRHVTAFDVDINALDDHPWRSKNVDILDYFNYGFNERTWTIYCVKQLRLRAEKGLGPHQLREAASLAKNAAAALNAATSAYSSEVQSGAVKPTGTNNTILQNLSSPASNQLISANNGAMTTSNTIAPSFQPPPPVPAPVFPNPTFHSIPPPSFVPAPTFQNFQQHPHHFQHLPSNAHMMAPMMNPPHFPPSVQGNANQNTFQSEIGLAGQKRNRDLIDEHDHTSVRSHENHDGGKRYKRQDDYKSHSYSGIESSRGNSRDRDHSQRSYENKDFKGREYDDKDGYYRRREREHSRDREWDRQRGSRDQYSNKRSSSNYKR